MATDPRRCAYLFAAASASALLATTGWSAFTAARRFDASVARLQSSVARLGASVGRLERNVGALSEDVRRLSERASEAAGAATPARR